MLDELFEAFLRGSIGEATYRAMPHINKRHALQRWQSDIKPSYSGPEDDEGFLDAGYMVPVPGIPDLPKKQISQGMLHMEKYRESSYESKMQMLIDLQRGRSEDFRSCCLED